MAITGIIVLGIILVLVLIFLQFFYKRREARELERRLSGGDHFGEHRIYEAEEVGSLRGNVTVPVAHQVSERMLMSTAEPIGGETTEEAPTTSPSNQLFPRQSRQPPEPSMPPPEPSQPPPDDGGGGSRMPARRPSRAERVSFLEQMHTEGKMSEDDYQAALQAIGHDDNDDNEAAPHHPLASATASTRSTEDVELAVV